MDIRSYFDRCRTFLHSFRYSTTDIYTVASEESFWDKYVTNWEKSKTLNHAKYVGTEWKHEEEFVSLLRKYASPEKEALEIGCGGGRITAIGVTLFKHVYAGDIAAEMLRKARQAVDAPGISFHKLDGFTLEGFSDSSLDFVYSHDVGVQLSSLQVYPYFMEMERVLKKDGLGLVSFYDFVGRFDLFKRTSLSLWNRRALPTYRRFHFVNEEMIRAMLDDLGLEVLEVDKRRFLTVAFRK